ncbi:MAG: membrane protein [Bacteroidetes bacterium OLB12]|nr:MAG: membrane protein [Bacteroidetes bacterium OLB12]
MSWGKNLGLVAIILISWGIALFEYILQVPANRIGFRENGGPFSLMELKVIQEVITLVVFVIFSLVIFQNRNLPVEPFDRIYLPGSGCLFRV